MFRKGVWGDEGEQFVAVCCQVVWSEAVQWSPWPRWWRSGRSCSQYSWMWDPEVFVRRDDWLWWNEPWFVKPAACALFALNWAKGWTTKQNNILLLIILKKEWRSKYKRGLFFMRYKSHLRVKNTVMYMGAEATGAESHVEQKVLIYCTKSLNNKSPFWHARLLWNDMKIHPGLSR